ncbi:alpha/beta hydrolase [Actinocorallia longicatena]|uniref:alpha/beta hydrolase n=1 Tax=Actinocorallia longicatena TaxID=111803 RepID=UPI0031DED44D
MLTAAVALSSVVGAPASAKGVKFKKAPDGARITAYKWVSKNKRQLDVTVKSPALGGQSVKVRLLLPRKWSMKSKRTWPIVYLYHGGHDNYTSWARNTDVETVASKYDAIVAMPEGANGSYTDWFNGGKGGTPKWESWHIREVIPLMQLNFRASKVRAAIGNSSGGQGAITYAARYSRQFKYAASLSGLLHILKPGVPTMLQYVNSGNGQDANAIWGDPVFDRGNWKLHNPYDLAAGLKGTKIFFSSGTTGRPGPGDPNVDPWDIGLISEAITGGTDQDFHKRLKQLKIPHIAHLYGDGRHNWPAWRREYKFVWPRMMAALHARKY